MSSIFSFYKYNHHKSSVILLTFIDAKRNCCRLAKKTETFEYIMFCLMIHDKKALIKRVVKEGSSICHSCFHLKTLAGLETIEQVDQRGGARPDCSSGSVSDCKDSKLSVSLVGGGGVERAAGGGGGALATRPPGPLSEQLPAITSLSCL